MASENTSPRPLASPELRRQILISARAKRRRAEAVIAEAELWNQRNPANPRDYDWAKTDLAWALATIQRYEGNP